VCFRGCIAGGGCSSAERGSQHDQGLRGAECAFGFSAFRRFSQNCRNCLGLVNESARRPG
jgi:hypothetical protein